MRISADPDIRQHLKSSLRWAIALGVLMFVIGVVAIIEPFTAAVAITVFVGFVFLMHGIFQVIYAFATRKLGAGWFVLQVLLGLLYLIAGSVLLKKPFEGLVTLTLIAGILIFVDGVIQVINAFDIKPLYGWGWTLFSGVLGVILGILIWSGWPQNSEWVLGILIGVNLMTNGLAVFMGSTAIRSAIDNAPPPIEA
ncbi:MAG: HdeD family acid-resistance protein [Cyanobacteria bacterium SBC]|nr:HdeD family acid-resistance protein [Cyanobacteria bacterium SBC]